MKAYEIIAVIWIVLALVWVLGNAFVTYSTGVHYSGEADYDHYHATKEGP